MNYHEQLESVKIGTSANDSFYFDESVKIVVHDIDTVDDADFAIQ